MNPYAITKIKKIFALLIMLCFVLPLSECSGGHDLPKPETGHSASSTAVKESEKEVIQKSKMKDNEFIPATSLNKEEPLDSLLMVIAFFFSIPFIAFSKKASGQAKKTAMYCIDLIFACFSAYWIVMMTLVCIYKPLPAGYLALTSIAMYILSTLTLLVFTLRKSVRWDKI